MSTATNDNNSNSNKKRQFKLFGSSNMMRRNTTAAVVGEQQRMPAPVDNVRHSIGELVLSLCLVGMRHILLSELFVARHLSGPKYSEKSSSFSALHIALLSSHDTCIIPSFRRQ
jgi:hypothetical protein